MERSIKRLLIAFGALISAGAVLGFTLQGPLAPWMTPRLGYNVDAPAQYGGPMVIGEEYRWNVPVAYYGFTPEWITYFGQRGIDEVDKAFKMLNDTPTASKINLDAFPLTSQRVNQQASALGLTDLRSMVLGLGLEQLGLANPQRYVFTLRNRWTTSDPDLTNYFTIRRNYDPVTWQPTSYINGILFTYFTILDGPTISLVLNEPVDPLAFLGVLNAPATAWWRSLAPGGFFTTLTRDDAGGLRYVYRPQNFNIETMGPSIAGTGGGPWGQPPGGTNVTTNVFVNSSLRPGKDKVTFQRVNYDSLLGFFVPFTNRFTDVYVTNSTLIPQYLERALVAPDILFHVADLQGGDGDDAIVSHNTLSLAWTLGNSGTNAPGGTVPGGNLGPGVINPGDASGPAFTITFNGVGEILFNVFPLDNLDEATASRFLFWGSFDGSTNAPVVYPVGVAIEEIDALVLRSGRYGNPWGPPPGVVLDPTDPNAPTQPTDPGNQDPNP
jgi:hypothetical protein